MLRNQRFYSVMIALTSLLLVAGCSALRGSGTDPAAAASATAGSPPEITETSAPDFQRPKDIDLRIINVCELLSELRPTDYGLDRNHSLLDGTSLLFPGERNCFVGGIQNNLSLTIVAVTTQGVGSYLDGANAKLTRSEAEGYPLTIVQPHNPADCIGVVDVHDDQMLYISYGLGSTKETPITPQVELCRTVTTIATAAVSVLDRLNG